MPGGSFRDCIDVLIGKLLGRPHGPGDPSERALDERWQSPVRVDPNGRFQNPFTYGGGDGTSVETAVHVQDVVRGIDLARAIHLWAMERFPGATVLDRNTDPTGLQFLVCGDRHYACVQIRMEDGRLRSCYFDDTEIFARSPAGRRQKVKEPSNPVTREDL